MRAGLLGRKLGHSYSPAIHRLMADYEYKLYEREPEDVEDFIKNGPWDALNVTIPYKKTVFPLCDAVSEVAGRMGSVNTIVRRADGTIYGDNTDPYGFEHLLRTNHVDPAGKKALVLGSGGASLSVCEVLERLGANHVVISRNGADNYTNLGRHADAYLIVNATPVGMYPNNGARPVDLAMFPACRAAVDLIYNPARTAFLLQAEALGIPAANGLDMLVAQARRSCEVFTGRALEENVIGRIVRALTNEMRNIVLVGMPGCGKTTVARLLSEETGRPVIDADALIAGRAGCSIPEIFARDGEEGFRRLETAVLQEVGRRSGAIIATGGGCVTRPENYAPLHQNGLIVWLKRDIDRLPREGRPLSQGDLHVMYDRRAPLYAAFADCAADNNGAAEEAVRQIEAHMSEQ